MEILMKNTLKVALLAAAVVNSAQSVEFKANLVNAKDKTVSAAKKAGSFTKDKAVAGKNHVASNKVAYGSGTLVGLTALAAFADYKFSGLNTKEWATAQAKDLLLVGRTSMKAKVLGWTLRTLVAANVLFGTYKSWTGLNMTNHFKAAGVWTKSKFTSAKNDEVEAKEEETQV
jgi:hypothetical protein